ncbi:ribosome maturation factor RimM [Eubacteriales bacterium OttesenSCG-928-N14]|nr:ribosome maturation factor RimM [Eubacteriales bacterium OttesenSCG-928-N14]
MKERYFRIGVIVKPQGIRGELKVQALTDEPKRFLGLKSLYLEQDGEYFAATVNVNRVEGESVYLYLDGVHSRDKAETLRNIYLAIPREEARVLPEDSWYISDLQGLSVWDETVRIGELVEVIQTGGVDVYRVKKDDGGYMMFPALKKVIAQVDTQGGQMRLNRAALDEVCVDED